MLNVTRILAPPEYDVQFPEAQEIVKNFTSALSKHLQTKILQTSIEDHWTSHRPYSISETFFAYFRKVSFPPDFLAMRDAYNSSQTFIDTLTHDYFNITSDFRRDYKVKFKHKPYVSPPTEWIW